MRSSAICLAAISFALCAAAAQAEDQVELAKKYVDFWQPLEGRWEITFEVEGTPKADDAAPAVWTYRKSSTGLCYLGEVAVDGTATTHGIHAYDPLRKHWHFLSYGVPGSEEDSFTSMAWLHVDLATAQRLAQGVTFLAETKEVMKDGTVVESTGRWTFPRVEPDYVEIHLTDGKRNGEPVPPGKLILKRRS